MDSSPQYRVIWQVKKIGIDLVVIYIKVFVSNYSYRSDVNNTHSMMVTNLKNRRAIYSNIYYSANGKI